MTPLDLLAQVAVLALVLVGIWKRDILNLMTDGNVERLEAAERRYLERFEKLTPVQKKCPPR